LTINTTSYFELSKISLKYMKKNKMGGSIINFTSIGGFLGFPNNPAYCASKGAVQQLTKSLAVDLSKFNIRVNNIVPGYIKTPMNIKSWKNKIEKKRRAERTILGRWGNTKDLIGATIFLSSEASSYITGTDIVVDGGWLSKGF
jgi:NAD(P)-dependent dehydrogenase (short-subunit alcohol dehydrogenase family)